MKLIASIVLFAALAFAQTAQFPASVATDEHLGVAKDVGRTTLASSVTSSTLTWTVGDGAAFSEKQIALCGSEQVQICTIVGNTLTLCTGSRGFNSTAAVAHSSGAAVVGVISSWYHNAMREEVQAIETALVNGTYYCGNYTSLQLCHDALPAGGGTMSIPSGTYLLAATLNVSKSNVLVRGAGIDSTIIRRGAAMGESVQTVYITGANVTIEELTVDGAGVVHEAGSEIASIGAKTMIRHNRIVNIGGYGISIQGAGSSVLDNSIEGQASTTAGEMGILVYQTSDTLIQGNRILDTTLNGIFTTASPDLRILANYFSGNHRQVSPTGGGQIAIADPSGTAIVANNTFATGGGNGTSGLELNGGVLASGNVIRNQQNGGIQLQAGTKNDLVGNTIEDSGNASIGASGITVAANVSSWQVIGGSIRDTRTPKYQTYGIVIAAGTSDNYIISGVDLSGNLTGPISNGGTGTSVAISGNLPSEVNNRGPVQLWLPTAACQNATATLLWDTPTSGPAVAVCHTGGEVQKAVGAFANTGSLSMQLTLVLPSDWHTALGINVGFKWFTSATSGSVVWQAATACVADGETDDTSFNAASVVADAAKVSASLVNDATITAVTATGCAAGELLHLKILRDPTHASDNLAATANLTGVTLSYWRTI